MATSYENTGGSGDRTAIITASSDIVFGAGNIAKLINGVTHATDCYFSGEAAANKYMKFDFGSGASKVIDEIKWYHSSTATTHGDWEIQGSNDDSSWDVLKEEFTLGGGGAETTTYSFSNTTGYRYYRLLGIDGNISGSPWIYEIEFKIDDAEDPPDPGDPSYGGLFFCHG